jgi:hypothetical protein
LRMLYRRRPGIMLLLLLLLALALTTTIIYAAGRLVYTASLDSRALIIGLTGPVNSLDPARINSHEERLSVP